MASITVSTPCVIQYPFNFQGGEISFLSSRQRDRLLIVSSSLFLYSFILSKKEASEKAFKERGQ
jgi:hypothetical protein